VANSKTNKTNSHLKDILLLFAVPVAIAILAAVVIYVPQLLANPKYDFVYSTCEIYNCKNSYSVDSRGYIKQSYTSSSKLDNYSRYDRTANLRYYDSSNDSARSLTIEEARRYKLNNLSKSPDGYTLTNESSNNGFLFWGEYDQGWYLKNGPKKKKVELTTTNSYYSRNVKFLGWVN
jgi:hypothetical protein